MSVINKLMWLACVLISVAFLALSYVVVGDHQRWLARSVTAIGTVIMVTTIGTMSYWVIAQRIETSRLRSIRRSSTSRSRSETLSFMEESEILENDYKKLYAIWDFVLSFLGLTSRYCIFLFVYILFLLDCSLSRCPLNQGADRSSGDFERRRGW